LLAAVRGRIQAAQLRAVGAANAELVRLYWDIGRMIDERQQRFGWGTAVIPRLAKKLATELPELRGFSERNVGLMVAFARQYPDPDSILQPAVAKLPAAAFWSVPWAHQAAVNPSEAARRPALHPGDRET
jgi:DUF1016 N-terminal domain